MQEFIDRLKQTIIYYTNLPHPSTATVKSNPKRSFPVLYKFNQNGKLQFWKIETTASTIIQTDGIVGGKIKKPNIRTVEANTIRTQEEQVLTESQKRWLDKIAKDHFPHPLDKVGLEIYNRVEAQRSENGGLKRGVTMWGETKITPSSTTGKTVLEDRLKPMLAKNYEDRKRFIFPASSVKRQTPVKLMIQPKLDGKRAICRIDTTTGKRCLESRGGKMYMGLDHITDEIAKIFPDNICPDGELFIYKLYRDIDGRKTKDPTGINCKEIPTVEVFQLLSEYVQHTSKKLNPDRVLVEFWIYDLYDTTRTNLERHKLLVSIISGKKLVNIKFVETITTDATPEIIEQLHQNYVDKGFEGIMIRQLDGKYAPGVHCNQLMKKKYTDDAEWTIVDAKASTGGLQDGTVIWLCEKDGVRVWAKQMGDVETNRLLYKNRKQHIGKLITLLYNDITADGVPRFPRAKCFRELDDMGDIDDMDMGDI